jgi:hypothetical protein
MLSEKVCLYALLKQAYQCDARAQVSLCLTSALSDLNKSQPRTPALATSGNTTPRTPNLEVKGNANGTGDVLAGPAAVKGAVNLGAHVKWVSAGEGRGGRFSEKQSEEAAKLMQFRLAAAEMAPSPSKRTRALGKVAITVIPGFACLEDIDLI